MKAAILSFLLLGCAVTPEYGDENIGWHENPNGSLTITISKENKETCISQRGCYVITDQHYRKIRDDYLKLRLMCLKEV